MLELLTTYTMTMRALAIVAGFLVFVDCMKIFKGFGNPIHDPKINAIGRAILSITAGIGGFGLIMFGQPTVGGNQSIEASLLVAYIWSGLGLGLSYRAASRAERPYLLWMSVSLFVVAGVVLRTLNGVV